MRVAIPSGITLQADRDFYFGWCQAADDVASVIRHQGKESARKTLADELASDTVESDEKLEHDPAEPNPGALIGKRAGMVSAFGRIDESK